MIQLLLRRTAHNKCGGHVANSTITSRIFSYRIGRNDNGTRSYSHYKLAPAHQALLVPPNKSLGMIHHLHNTTQNSTTSSSKHKNKTTKCSVVILGGGPTGLFLSTLLSRYNIPSTLLESRTPSQIAQHPQAHYLNLRTMEIIRHSMPDLYQSIVGNSHEDDDGNKRKSRTTMMPPRSEWEGFTFCYSVLGRQIARVVHPVTPGLPCGQDGNGILVNDVDIDGTSSNKMYDNDGDGGIGISSVCGPGHLAQNKFSTILLEEARRAAETYNHHHNDNQPNNEQELVQILHDVTVNAVIEANHQGDSLDANTNNLPLEVHTSTGEILHTQYVIAADGSASPTRTAYDHDPKNNPIMMGNPSMQHLINVHFKIKPNSSLNKRLGSQSNRVGMLHFVFNPKVVGAFVCHDLKEGEWVLQIPYFPPFQESSSFVENVEEVRDCVLAGLAMDAEVTSSSMMMDEENYNYKQDVDILSIKPWTMSSTVAQSYFLGESKRIILAGDAAHAFPPAGGFGMNTGIQDAHNLAWRLAHVLQQQDDDKKRYKKPTNVLTTYEIERKPIAAQNAALSVRNYNRTLEIAKACYLNADHPALLKQVMDLPPLGLMPLSFRQNAFQTAVTTAMMPLSNLATRGNLFGDNVEKNVRRILESGGGLPLLFPRYEIGFSYNFTEDGDGGSGLLSDEDDTAGYIPSLDVGRRLPYIPLQFIGSIQGDNIVELDDCHFVNGVIPDTDNKKRSRKMVALTDLESQIQRRWKTPKLPHHMVVLCGNHPSLSTLGQQLTSRMTEMNVPYVIAEILWEANMVEKRFEELSSNRYLGAGETENEAITRSIFLDVHNGIRSLHDSSSNLILLVRPDGHIAEKWTVSEDSKFEKNINRVANQIMNQWP